MASKVLAKLTRYFRRTIDVTQALCVLASTMPILAITHKDPMLNMNNKAAFFRPPSCSFNNSGIGKIRIAMSSTMLKTAPA